MPTYKFKLLTQGDLFTYETDARTLGEFRTQVRGNADLCTKFGVRGDSDLSELHLIERSTKTSYIMDNAVLPQTNSLFFVSLTKSEGGAIFGESFFSEQLSEYDLIELAIHLNAKYDTDFDLFASYDDLYEAIEEFYEEEKQESPKETIILEDLNTKEKLEAIADILLNISIGMEEGYNKPIGICIDGVTFDALDKEADALYSKLRTLGMV